MGAERDLAASRLHDQLHAGAFDVELAWRELAAGPADVSGAPLPSEVLVRVSHDLHDLWTARLDPDQEESELVTADVEARRDAAAVPAAASRARVHLHGTQDPRERLRRLLRHALARGLWTRSERLMLRVILAYDLDETSHAREVAARAAELERIAREARTIAPNLSAWATLLAARLWRRARAVPAAEEQLCRCVGEVLAADALTRVGGASFSLAGLVAGVIRRERELGARLLELVRRHREVVELASVRLDPGRLEDRVGAVALLALLDEGEAASLRGFQLVELAGLRLGVLGCGLGRPGARRSSRQQWAIRRMASIAEHYRQSLERLPSPTVRPPGLLREDPRALVELVMLVVARCPDPSPVAERLRARHLPGWLHGDGWQAVVDFDAPRAEAALAAAGPGEARAAALAVLASLRELQCRAGEAAALHEEVLAELDRHPAQPSRERAALAWQAGHGLGLHARGQQQLEVAIARFERAAVVAEAAGLLSRAAASQAVVARILRDQALEVEADRRLGAARLTAVLAVCCGQVEAAPILADLVPNTRLRPRVLERLHRTRFRPRVAPGPDAAAKAAETEALRWLAVLAEARTPGSGAACLTLVHAQLGREEQVKVARAAAERVREVLRQLSGPRAVARLGAPAPALASAHTGTVLDALDRARRSGPLPPRTELEILISAANQLLREWQGSQGARELLARAHDALVALRPAAGWTETGAESAVLEVLASCELELRPERVAALRAEQLRWRVGVLRGVESTALRMQHRRLLERSLASSLRDLVDGGEAGEAAELVALVKRGDLGVEELATDGEEEGGLAREEEVLLSERESASGPGSAAAPSVAAGRIVCLDYFLAPGGKGGPVWEALVIVHVAEPGAAAMRPIRVLTLRPSGPVTPGVRLAHQDCRGLAAGFIEGTGKARAMMTHARRLGALLLPPALLETLRTVEPALVLLCGHGPLFHVPLHALPFAEDAACLLDLYPVAYVAQAADGLTPEPDPVAPMHDAGGWPVLVGEPDAEVDLAWASATEPAEARLCRVDDAALAGTTDAIERLAAARHGAFVGHGVHESARGRSWRSRLRLSRGGRLTVRAAEQAGPEVRGAELVIMACNAASRAGGAHIGVLDALVRLGAGVVVAPLSAVRAVDAGAFLRGYVGARQRGLVSTLAFREALRRLRGGDGALTTEEAWQRWIEWSPFVLYRGR